MKTIEIKPSSLRGEVVIPSSKSIGHRAVICASLSEGTSRVNKLKISQDILATINAMKALGAQITIEGDALTIQRTVTDHEDPNRSKDIFCNESGSTLRFLIPVSMLFDGEKIFTGKEGLSKRPLSEFVRIFNEKNVAYAYNGELPMVIEDTLPSGEYVVNGNESSQYISGLLMALPLLKGDSRIVIKGELESRDYVALTLETMADFGVRVKNNDHGSYDILGGQHYRPIDYTVEGDYSQAAFFIVAGLIGKYPIICKNLRENSSQADKRVIEIVEAMGGKIEFRGSDLVVFPSTTRGTIIDASQCPDIIPVLCVLGAISLGETRVINGGRLRIKESDRIKSTVSELSKLGAEIVETQDGMVITGKSMLKGGVTHSWGDHRIAMAMAIAAIRCESPVSIEDYEAVAKSYPDFFQDYRSLGGITLE